MKGWRETGCNLGLLLLRVAAGVGIALHGYDKLFVKHIADFARTMVEPMGFPAPLLFAYLAAFTEFLGGIFIVVGLGTRLVSAALVFNMSVAVFVFHKGAALSAKELALAYLVAAATILFAGPGAFSLDRIIFGKKRK